MLVRLIPLMKFYAKENTVEKKIAVKKTEIIVISSAEENFLELKHLVGDADYTNFSYLSFRQIRNLKEEILETLESADVVLVYSKSPLAELPEVAFTLHVLKFTTFRYFCLLYGSNSTSAAEILKEHLVANPCKIFPIHTKEDLLKETRRNLLKVVPLESLPSILKLEIFDGYRTQESLKVFLKAFVRFYVLYAVSPVIAMNYLPEFCAVAYLLLKNLAGSNPILKYAARGAVILAPLLFRKKIRIKIPPAIPALFLLLILLLEIPDSVAKNEY